MHRKDQYNRAKTSEKRNTLGKNSRSMVESGMDNGTKYGFIKRVYSIIYCKNGVTDMV